MPRSTPSTTASTNGAVNQGGTANTNGHTLEDTMIPMFEHHGFDIVQNADITRDPSVLKDRQRYVIRNAPFTTIYASKGKTEFVIVDLTQLGPDGAPGRKVRVEAKWQQTPGSVDEKYPYMLLNGIYQYPESEIVFVVDGGGYKKQARQWLQDAINNDWLQYREQQHKDIQLMSLAEFMSWFNKEFR